jgi:hypothetical protein
MDIYSYENLLNNTATLRKANRTKEAATMDNRLDQLEYIQRLQKRSKLK